MTMRVLVYMPRQ